ncbi:hypothetical protein NQ318_021985 [Aromia moschata]|uniref:Sensory neuron membrane protein 2 n=1 Tax=Aromia moschata TaxID=1265417 RepID=A0AAV8Z624_9CUCU|nr:hypothetical protein NQ318_021985 [Aromia moschata]
MISKFKVHLNRKNLLFTGALGLIFLCAGIYLGFKAIPDYITDKIWEMKILKPNTEQWDIFMKVPFPFTFKVYIFDVQNPQDILQGATPVVKEKGPYIYKVYKWKSDIEWNSTDTISYFGYMRFEFDKDASGTNSEEDSVTILNTPYNSMLLTVEATQPNVLTMFDQISSPVFGENDGLFINVKVKDYLFDGLRICENLGKEGGFAPSMVCKQVVAKLDEAKNMRMVNNTILFSNLYYISLLTVGTYCFISRKNNTHLGKFTVKSGIKNREEAGVLKFYNGQRYISTWLGENSHCNEVRGVTTIFPVQIQKNMVFESFAEDVCRTMALQYEQEETVKGISGYKFVAANDSFNATKDNYCFCVNKTRTLEGGFGCLKDGLVDLTTCTDGSEDAGHSLDTSKEEYGDFK